MVVGCSHVGNIPDDLHSAARYEPRLARTDVAPPRFPWETSRQYLTRVVPPITDDQIDSHIDASITGQDRSIIKNVMRSIPTYARENVIYVDQAGHIFANRRSLIATTVLSKPAPGQTGTFVEPSGTQIAVPTFGSKPGSSARSLDSVSRRPMYGTPPETLDKGPYRRVYSDPGTWYGGGMHAAFAPNAATLNGSTTYDVGPYQDAGYIYSGGWSTSGNDAADAGLLYSAARNVANAFISVYSNPGEITSNAHNYAPNYDDEIDFIIGCEPDVSNPSACSSTPSGPYLATFNLGHV